MERFASEEARAENGQKDQEHRRRQAMDHAQTRGGHCEEVSDPLQVKCPHGLSRFRWRLIEAPDGPHYGHERVRWQPSIARAYEALTNAAAIGRVPIPAAAPLQSLRSLRTTEQC